MKSVWAACASIAALYVAEAASFTHALHYSMPMPHAGVYRIAAGIAAALLTGAVYWLYVAVRRLSSLPAVPILACALIMGATSFAFINPHRDALAYIAYAKQPTFASAYNVPPDYVLPPGFSEIKREWPALPTCSYGPLWLWVARALTGPVQSLAGCMLVMRFIGLLSLVLMFAAVVRLRAPPAVVAATIANPFWYFFYVLEAHNDGLALMLVAAAMAIAVPLPFVAPVVAGAAALVKAPFILIGALAFSGARSARNRLWLQLAILAAVAVAGSLFGGRRYFEKLFFHGTQTYSTSQSTLGHLFAAIHIALAILAIVAIAAAVLRARFSGPLSFSFVALSSFPYPWYLGWGLPYAYDTPFVPAFLALLSVFGFLMNSEPVARLFEAAVLVAAIAVFLRRRYQLRTEGAGAAVPLVSSR